MNTKSILIVSPIPSHPQNQGNSARIYRLGRMWQDLGYRVHFFYFGMEGLAPGQEIAMSRCWDHFYYLHPHGAAPQPSFGEYYHIDDWYDDRVSSFVEELAAQWRFDVCLVNYVWFSKVLDALPRGVQKIIDTHDVFGDRHLVARAAGMEPVWFYTTRELEARGLNRADLVIAIQDEEKAYFESVCSASVEVIGYVLPPHFLPERDRSGVEKLRVGYIGSGNPFNERSIRIFQEEVKKLDVLFDRFEFHIAGSICDRLGKGNDIFRTWGMVDEVIDFYRDIDIMINPMVGGTGLKIKSLEAMAFGRPLLGTGDAMVGIGAAHPAHGHESVGALVAYLAELDPESGVHEVREATRSTLQAYNERFRKQMWDLFV